MLSNRREDGGQATALSHTVPTLGTSDITPHRRGVSTTRCRAIPSRSGSLAEFSRFLSEDANQLILFDIQSGGTGRFSPRIVLTLERFGADRPGTTAKRHPFR